jgi:UDP-glucose 4-epimerase
MRRTSDGRLGIVTVGYGYWGPNIARNVIEHPDLELLGLCEPNPVRAAEFSTRFPGIATHAALDDALQDPHVDAVMIATPPGTHHAIAARALRAGKHVLVEKPLATSVADATDLIDIAAVQGLVLMPGHTFIYSPAVMKVSELIREDVLGEIYFATSSRMNLGKYQHDGVIRDLAPHDLSILMHWLDQPVVQAAATARSIFQADVPETAFLTLGFAGGAQANVQLSWLAPSKVRHSVVVGSKRMIQYDDTALDGAVRIYDRGLDFGEPPSSFGEHQLTYRSGDIVVPRLDAAEPLRLELSDFAHAITTGATPRSSARLGLEIVRVLEALEASLRNAGEPVAVHRGEEWLSFAAIEAGLGLGPVTGNGTGNGGVPRRGRPHDDRPDATGPGRTTGRAPFYGHGRHEESAMRGKRVLITGGAGVVGSTIADQLVEQAPAEIVVLDNLVRGRRENLAKADASGLVRFVEGDIRDRALVRSLMDGIDVVFHQAAIRITQCAEEPRLALDVLVDGTFNVVEAAVQTGVRRLVAASSASVYGMAEAFPTGERHHPYANDTLYGAAKTFNEGLLRSFHATHGLDWVALRYFNVYGPRMDIHGVYTEVLVRWMERIEAGVPPLVLGDGSQTMDFVFVEDIARANVLAARADATDEVFNIGAGIETSLLELAQTLLRVMGSDLPIEHGEARAVNNVSRRLADVSRARDALGFEAQVGLEEGLTRLVAWWRAEQARADGRPLAAATP